MAPPLDVSPAARSTGSSAVASSTITLGVSAGARRDARQAALDAMVPLLSADTGLEVTAQLCASSTELALRLTEGAVDLAWIAPATLLTTPELAGVVPLLTGSRDGLTEFHALLYTSATAPFETADDLAGADVAWVSPDSSAGYLVPRLALARRGYDVATFFHRETFYETHAAAARAVMSGQADVGATYGHFEGGDRTRRLLAAGFQELGPFVRARVVDVSGPVPEHMIVAHADLPSSSRVAVAAALSRMVHDPIAGPHLREALRIDDFRPVTPDAISSLRNLFRGASTLT